MADERTTVKREVIIAVVALLISGLTAAASLIQTRVIAQQLSSQVWPYVTIASTASRDRIETNVDNDGLGPAIVGSFVLMVDGKPQHDMLAAMYALVGKQKLAEPGGDLDLSALTPNQVLRPSSSTVLFRITNKHVVPQLVSQIVAHVSFRLCYCSIVDNCWLLNLPAQLAKVDPEVKKPHAISQCPDETANQLQEPDPRQLENTAL